MHFNVGGQCRHTHSHTHTQTHIHKHTHKRVFNTIHIRRVITCHTHKRKNGAQTFPKEYAGRIEQGKKSNILLEGPGDTDCMGIELNTMAQKDNACGRVLVPRWIGTTETPNQISKWQTAIQSQYKPLWQVRAQEVKKLENTTHRTLNALSALFPWAHTVQSYLGYFSFHVVALLAKTGTCERLRHYSISSFAG